MNEATCFLFLFAILPGVRRASRQIVLVGGYPQSSAGGAAGIATSGIPTNRQVPAGKIRAIKTVGRQGAAGRSDEESAL